LESFSPPSAGAEAIVVGVSSVDMLIYMVEVMVVDDGSYDMCFEMCPSYRIYYYFISIILQTADRKKGRHWISEWSVGLSAA
jgi:hypothetical protein